MFKKLLLCSLIWSAVSLADASALPSTASSATLQASSSNSAPLATSSNTASLPASNSNTSLIATTNTNTMAASGNGSLIKSNAIAAKSLTQFCPSIDQLVKDPQKLTWSAAGGWQGYQQSFASSILTFTGVQWAGIQVGQVICTYKGKEKDTFPIQLVYNKLVLQPSGGAWGQNMGGYINCTSANVNDCPFPVQLAQQTDVLKEAASIQASAPQEQAF